LIDLMAQPIDHKPVLRMYRVDVNHYKGSPAKLLRGEIPPINASQARGPLSNKADDPVSTGADSPAKVITASAQTPNRRERSSRRRADAVEWVMPAMVLG
jgi:hypothetical protein